MDKFCFSLKKALRDANLTPAEFARLTNYSKATVSNWVNGKKMPGKDALKTINEILHLEEEEIEKPDNNLPVKVAAYYMNKSTRFVERGLQDDKFPWGYAVKTDSGRWSYFINKGKFFRYEEFKQIDH